MIYQIRTQNSLYEVEEIADIWRFRCVEAKQNSYGDQFRAWYKIKSVAVLEGIPLFLVPTEDEQAWPRPSRRLTTSIIQHVTIS